MGRATRGLDFDKLKVAGDGRTAEGRHEELLGYLASGQQEDSADGSGRVHRPLHAAAGLILRLPMNCTSWPATRLRAMRLGVLERAARKLIGLTGTLMGGYADDLFNIFYRMEAGRIVGEGFAYGGEGRREFQEQFGVLETIERITESDNACTRASKKTVQILKKPGASPLLFGKFLMSSTAFVSLEDIADNLPPYDESVLPSEMDEDLATAYRELERDLRKAMQDNRGTGA